MTRRVLVVEDNPANLHLMQYLLGSFGWEVVQAVDAERALERIEDGRFALILLDLHLPGMSGFELLTQLRRRLDLEEVPIAAVTALAMVGDREKVMAAGFDGYITKPIDPRKLRAAIESIRRLPRPGSGHS